VSGFLLSLQVGLIDGLPFGSPPRSERLNMMGPMLVFGPVAIGIGWALQRFLLFPSRILTLVATFLFAAAAIGLARQTLDVLDVKVRATLARLADGAPGLFQSPMD
jgi:hypothetical protein